MKKLIGLIAIVAIAAGLAYGDSVRTWNGDNASPVFRVKNSGNEKVTITFGTANAVTVTNGTAVTSITIADGYTVASLAAALEAATNSAVARTLSVDAGCSLAADIVSNNMVAATITIPNNQHQYVDGLKWNTTNCLFFSTYCPPSTKGGVGDIKTVSKLFGDLRGTGNITIVGYVDGTEVYAKYITSPVYVNGQYWFQAGTSTNVTDNVGPGEIDIDLGVGVGRGEGVMFRATRATTATQNGGMGMVIDLKD